VSKATSFSAKVDHFKQQLLSSGASADVTNSIHTVSSNDQYYRMRAEFRIWHEGDETNYAMHHPDTKNVYTIEDFPVASKRINEAMPELIKLISPHELLRKRLFQVEFLSTLSGELLISLIYHKQLNEEWDELAKEVGESLDAYIIGRARKQKRVLSQDFVMETLTIFNKEFKYQQVENSFTQPNAVVCQQMIEWAIERTKGSKDSDLLELYCGNGNFTLPLAQNFNRVLATEVSKPSVRSAQHNIALNKVDNVTIARLSSEEFVEAYTQVRPFRRLKDIDLQSYQFDTLFVDPPRAGLDPLTLELSRKFDRIVYISCNPETLIDNLAELQEYSISHAAAFDQFPNTHHLEVGVILDKRV